MVDLSIPHRRPTGTVLVADSSMSIVHPSTSPRLSASTHLALSDDGPDFIETTFGVSRPMWKLIRRVTTIVAASRQYQDDATPVGRMQAAYARAEAEAIVAELWHAWEFSDKWQQSGRPLRVQQGTMVRFVRAPLSITLLPVRSLPASTDILDVRTDVSRSSHYFVALRGSLYAFDGFSSGCCSSTLARDRCGDKFEPARVGLHVSSHGTFLVSLIANAYDQY